MSRRRMWGWVVVVITVATVGVGCGNASTNSVRSEGGSTTTKPTKSNDASSYVGLTKTAATIEADAAGHPWRIGREDGQAFPARLQPGPHHVRDRQRQG